MCLLLYLILWNVCKTSFFKLQQFKTVSFYLSLSFFFFEVSKKELQLVILQINTLQKA